jgi:hypothetical protein
MIHQVARRDQLRPHMAGGVPGLAQTPAERQGVRLYLWADGICFNVRLEEDLYL